MYTYQELIKERPDLFTNQDATLLLITNPYEIEEWEKLKTIQLQAEKKPLEWGKIGIVYNDPYIHVLRDLVKFPSGLLGSYFRIINTADLNGGKGSVILPIFDNKIVLLRQFRHSTRKWHWEIPRGFGEPNTTPEENAKREIFEEIKGIIAKLIDLGPYHSNTGIEGNEVELFLATLNSIGNINQDEGIESFQLFALNKIEEMIRDAEITDGFTIAAFTRAKYKKLI